MSKQDSCQIDLYEFKLGRSAVKGLGILMKIKEVLMKVQRWYQTFRRGEFSLEGKEDCRRLSAVNGNELKIIVKANPLKITREMAEEIDLDLSTVARHLGKIGKVKMLEK